MSESLPVERFSDRLLQRTKGVGRRGVTLLKQVPGHLRKTRKSGKEHAIKTFKYLHELQSRYHERIVVLFATAGIAFPLIFPEAKPLRESASSMQDIYHPAVILAAISISLLINDLIKIREKRQDSSKEI